MIKTKHQIYLEAKIRIIGSSDYSSLYMTKALYNLLTSIVEEVTQDEKIIFTTLFSRVAFLGNKYRLNAQFLYYLHTFRRDNERMLISEESDHYVKLGSFLVDQLISRAFLGETEIDEIPEDISDKFNIDKLEIVKFKPIVEAIVDSVDVEKFIIYFYEDENGSVLRQAIFDKGDRNELFNDSVVLLDRSFQFPIHVNFVDVEIMEDGSYVPRAMVIEPDYLLDVTAVANCFKDYGTEPMLRLISKFKRVENSIPLMVGNVSNLFLDEIISNPDVKFNDLIPSIFRLDPLGLSVYTDREIRELISIARLHYLNLKRAIALDIPTQGIKRKKVYLEPSFYSRDYGIQGRLDLFHYDEENNKYDIVELKSGKPWRANVYGLSASHYSQTLLYDLMVKSAFGYYRKPNNYILYSKLNEKSLKYAPPVKSQQYEAMKVRNDLIAIEYKMGASPSGAAALFHYLQMDNFPKTKGFEMNAVNEFSKLYQKLSRLERSYFEEFSSFISREHRMAKIGEHGIHKSNGLSALWLENLDEKEDRFAILKMLVISSNKSPAVVVKVTTMVSANSSTSSSIIDKGKNSGLTV